MGFLSNVGRGIGAAGRSFGNALMAPGILQSIGAGQASIAGGGQFGTGFLSGLQQFQNQQAQQQRLGMLQAEAEMKKQEMQRQAELAKRQEEAQMYAAGALPAYAQQLGINLPSLSPEQSQALLGKIAESQVSQAFAKPDLANRYKVVKGALVDVVTGKPIFQAPEKQEQPYERYKVVGGALVDPATGKPVYQAPEEPPSASDQFTAAKLEAFNSLTPEQKQQVLLKPQTEINMGGEPSKQQNRALETVQSIAENPAVTSMLGPMKDPAEWMKLQPDFNELALRAARVLQPSGVLSDQDIENARSSYIPNITDPPSVRMKKLQNLANVLAGEKEPPLLGAPKPEMSGGASKGQGKVLFEQGGFSLEAVD